MYFKIPLTLIFYNDFLKCILQRIYNKKEIQEVKGVIYLQYFCHKEHNVKKNNPLFGIQKFYEPYLELTCRACVKAQVLLIIKR